MLSTYIYTSTTQLIFNDISRVILKKNNFDNLYKGFIINIINNIVFIGGSYILNYDDFDEVNYDDFD
jgi:hypothetical protein